MNIVSTLSNTASDSALRVSSPKLLVGRIALIVSLCLTLIACKKADDTSSSDAEQAAQTEDAEAEKDGAKEDAPVDTSRIVSLNGAITETLIALGLEDNIVGVDISSTYPESVTELPNIGYYRRLSDEGILGLDPTLIIGEDEAGPAPVIHRIRSAGVSLALIETTLTEEGVIQRMKDVAHAVELEEEGDALIEDFKAKLEEAKKSPGLTDEDAKPKVLGVYARGAGLSMVGGANTPFDVVIQLAGAENAAADLVGFQPLSPEALAMSEADIILIPDDGLEALGGIEGLLKFPGVKQTSAGKEQRILHYEDQLLLGLGPRMPSIISVLRADFAKAMGHEVVEDAE